MFRFKRKLNKEEMRVVECLKRFGEDCEMCRESKERVRSKMWACIEDHENHYVRARSTFFFQNKFTVTIASLVLVLTLGIGTSVASDKSVPGDALYPVDRAVEKVQIVITLSEGAKNRLMMSLAEERIDELRLVRQKVEVEEILDPQVVFMVEDEIISDVSETLVAAGQMVKQQRSSLETKSSEVESVVTATYEELDRMHQVQAEEIGLLAAQVSLQEAREELLEMQKEVMAEHREILNEMGRMYRLQERLDEIERDIVRPSILVPSRPYEFPDFPVYPSHGDVVQASDPVQSPPDVDDTPTTPGNPDDDTTQTAAEYHDGVTGQSSPSFQEPEEGEIDK